MCMCGVCVEKHTALNGLLKMYKKTNNAVAFSVDDLKEV